VIAAICGAVFLLLAGQLKRTAEDDRRTAHRLFVFSIAYLFMLFAVLLIDHNSGSFSSMRSAHGGRCMPVHAASESGADHGARCTVNLGEA
jgi:protoheme IX farnesyltransferase